MAKKATRKKPPPSPRVVHDIADQLIPLAEPIGSIKPDPKNARLHNDKNIQSIAASLTRYGQRKPVIVNQRNGIVEAGNGTVEAAKLLNWTHVAVLWVDDDQQAQNGFAIADNRTAELATWDKVQLDALLVELNDQDATLIEDLAFESELQKIAKAAEADTSPQLKEMEYRVVIQCNDEDHQREILEMLEGEGIECKALML